MKINLIKINRFIQKINKNWVLQIGYFATEEEAHKYQWNFKFPKYITIVDISKINFEKEKENVKL